MLGHVAGAAGIGFLATGAAAADKLSSDSGTTFTGLSLFIGALASLIVAATSLIKLLRPAKPTVAEQLALEVLKQQHTEEEHAD